MLGVRPQWARRRGGSRPKIKDTLGRPATCYVGTLFHVPGYVVQAAALNSRAMCGGFMLDIFRVRASSSQPSSSWRTWETVERFA